MTMTSDPATFDPTPTWGEVFAGWNPDTDGQGNEGLAAALDRMTAERAAAAEELARLVADYETAQENLDELRGEAQQQDAIGQPWPPLGPAIGEAYETRDAAEARCWSHLELHPYLPVPAVLPL